MNTKTALKKILDELLVYEYPQVREISISGREFLLPKEDGFGSETRTQFDIFLYGNLASMDDEEMRELKNATKRIGSYVLGHNERIFNVFVIYDPKN
jgi:hypothetical protein